MQFSVELRAEEMNRVEWSRADRGRAEGQSMSNRQGEKRAVLSAAVES